MVVTLMRAPKSLIYVTSEFDTVLMAIGRYGNTKHLGLEKVGVKVNSQNGKVAANIANDDGIHLIN